jgi:GT2 family glycosyltransferase
LTLHDENFKMKKICPVILNWKGAQDTIDCLQSFLTQSLSEGLHLVVIDNASPDESVELIVAWARTNGIPFEILDHQSVDGQLVATDDLVMAGEPRLTLVRSDENNGFCVGNNLGARIAFEAGADYVLVLNNDTVVGPNFNANLQAVLANDDGKVLYSPQIAYASEPDTIWWFGGRFSRLLSPTYVGQGKPISADDGSQPQTEWVSGCATLISHNIYDQLGLYDPIFFIWCEEWDLSLRAAEADVPMRILPGALVYHKVGKSLGITSPLTFFYAMRNMLILRRRYLPWFLLLPFNMVYLPHKLFQAVRLGFRQRDRRYLLGFADALTSTRTGGKWRRQD